MPIDKRSIACYGTDSVEKYMNRVDVQVSYSIGGTQI